MMQFKLHGRNARGLFALVDDDIYHKYKHLNWTLRTLRGDMRSVVAWMDVNGKNKIVKLHRLAAGHIRRGMRVDHINGNVLDNRRLNLRICTETENNRNRAAHKGSVSKHKGVVWDKPKLKWRAQISLDGKRKFLGYFESEDDAARNYDWWAMRVHREFARLNFPGEDYSNFTPKVMP